MGKLKDQLAGIAALIAAIVAIGGGFVKYGEIVTNVRKTYDNVGRHIVGVSWLESI